MWLLAVFALGAVVALVAWLRVKVPTGTTYIVATDSYLPPFEANGVGVIRIAIDRRARRFVETSIARITAIGGDPSTQLRDVTQLLRRVRDVWVHGSAFAVPARRELFDQQVADAKASTSTGSALLVTIIIATRDENAIATITDPEELRKVLEAAWHRMDLVALEIACAPYDAVATLGDDKAFCADCGGPVLAELVSCPHCGVPTVRAA